MGLQKKGEQLPSRPQPTTIEILEAAVKGGVTAENVAVVKEIIAMRLEEEAAISKKAFAKSFFDLRKKLSTMDIYADKSAKDDGGKIVFRYCSEEELSKILEPVLFEFGFVMLFGQQADEQRVVAEITLIHEAGHQEIRSYAVRTGATNRMKDATAADTGSTTSAWRHLVIKMFGLKSRIKEGDDPRNEGERITVAQAEELQRRVKETESNEFAFLKFAGVGVVSGTPTLEHYKSIMSGRYDELDSFLRKKEQRGR